MKKWTRTENETMKAAVEAGMGATWMQDRFHVSYPTLMKELKRQGLEVTFPRGRVSTSEQERREARFIENMRKREFSRLATAKAMGITVPQLDTLKRKYGISFRNHKITEYEMQYIRRKYPALIEKGLSKGKAAKVIAEDISFTRTTVEVWINRLQLEIVAEKLPNGEVIKTAAENPNIEVKSWPKAGNIRPAYIEEKLEPWHFKKTAVNQREDLLYAETIRTLMVNQMHDPKDWDLYTQLKEYGMEDQIERKKIKNLQNISLKGKQTNPIKPDLNLA